MSLMKTQKGFGIIETLVGFAILGAATFAIMNGLDYIEKNKSKTDKNISLENMLSSVVESARSNIIMEKVDFQANSTFLSLTNFNDVRDSLKMCWVKDGLIPLADYPDCPGRFGYVVSPFQVGNLQMRGLYQVTIRTTHSQLFPERFKQYTFIVRGP